MTHAATRFLALLSLVVAPALAQEAAPAIEVRCDPRVELMCVLFRLAGNPEYNQARVATYAEAVDAHFAKFRDHAAVRSAQRMRRSSGVSYDAVMSMALHLPGTGRLQGAIDFAQRPPALDRRWQERDTERFLAEAQDFVRKSRFAKFLAEHRELYDLTERRLHEVLAANIEMEWFAGFFGERPRQRFTVIPGLLNGGGSYGPRVVHPDGREDLFSVLGVWQTDGDGAPRFDAKIVDTVVHEFCHSFCNPLVEANRDALRGAGERIWPHVADTMKAQAYGNWETVMKETLVRTCTVRYVAATRGAKEHARAVAYEEGRGFAWVGALSQALVRYEGERDEYETLAAFMPEYAAALERSAEQFVAREKDLPKVVGMQPANGSDGVDPGVEAIVVTFDRPMRDKSWAVVGGGPRMPAIAGELRYDEARVVLTIPVELKPATSYEFWLNRGRYDSFRSEQGGILRSVHVTFRTR